MGGAHGGTRGGRGVSRRDLTRLPRVGRTRRAGTRSRRDSHGERVHPGIPPSRTAAAGAAGSRHATSHGAHDWPGGRRGASARRRRCSAAASRGCRHAQHHPRLRRTGVRSSSPAGAPAARGRRLASRGRTAGAAGFPCRVELRPHPRPCAGLGANLHQVRQRTAPPEDAPRHSVTYRLGWRRRPAISHRLGGDGRRSVGTRRRDARRVATVVTQEMYYQSRRIVLYDTREALQFSIREAIGTRDSQADPAGAAFRRRCRERCGGSHRLRSFAAHMSALRMPFRSPRTSWRRLPLRDKAESQLPC